MILPVAPIDNRFRILLLEDDDEVARNVLALLEQAGFHCRHAYDPDFVGWVEADPHIVLLEYQSATIDAFTVCRQIREGFAGAGTGIPILILGPADEATEIAALKAGADDYLPEPLRPSVVMARVVTHLRRAYRYNDAAPQAATAPVQSPQISQGAEVAGVQAAGAQPTTPSGMPAFIGDIPLWQDEDVEALPLGWAECTLCGHRGPGEEFESEDLLGREIVICPNPKCNSSEHVMFAIG